MQINDIMMPKILMIDKKFKHLSSSGKLLYSLLYANLWNEYISGNTKVAISKGYDDTYITLSNKNMAQILNKSETAIVKKKKELVSFNLLEIHKRPYDVDKLYLTIV